MPNPRLIPGVRGAGVYIDWCIIPWEIVYTQIFDVMNWIKKSETYVDCLQSHIFRSDWRVRTPSSWFSMKNEIWEEYRRPLPRGQVLSSDFVRHEKQQQQQQNNMVAIDLFNHTEKEGTVTWLNWLQTIGRNGLVWIAWKPLKRLNLGAFTHCGM